MDFVHSHHWVICVVAMNVIANERVILIDGDHLNGVSACDLLVKRYGDDDDLVNPSEILIDVVGVVNHFSIDFLSVDDCRYYDTTNCMGIHDHRDCDRQMYEYAPSSHRHGSNQPLFHRLLE